MEQLSDFAADPDVSAAHACADAAADVATLIRTRDWSDSPLGAPASWSASLQTLMRTVLPVKAQIVLFWGPQYVALYNDAYVPSIGAKHPRALGRPAQENWTELWDDLEPLLRGVRETGETFAAKDRPFYIERHGAGETVYFDVSYSAVRDDDDSIGGVLCIVTETTERVQFERRQAFLLELGRALPATSAPDHIEAIAVRKLGEELGASRVFFGEDNGDGVTFDVAQEFLDGAHSALGRHRYRSFGGELLRSLQAGLPVTRHYRNDDGNLPEGEAQTRRDLQLAATLHVPVIRHGVLEAVLAVHHEQPHSYAEFELRLAEETAKQAWTAILHARAEAALRASSAQLSAMFDQASAGIALCDREGYFKRVNERYCEIVGRSREELLHTRLQEIDELSPSGSLMPKEIVRRHLRPDGSDVWVQDQLTPLLDEQRAVTGMLCVCVDISARIRAENELRGVNEGLEERVAAMVAQRETAVAQLHEARKMEMIGQLTGGIAHDFNNLLTPIMASLELVRRRLDDERSTTLIDGALQAADRARILVGRLLTFARRQTLKPQVVSLRELVSDMRDLIERSLGSMIEVVIEIPERLPAVIVDPHQLELAVLNLAVNARDAMAEGGQLKIVGKVSDIADGQFDGIAAGRYVGLVVSDNGSGMSAQTLARCLEPFFSTKGVGKGTGLGLSMVQGLAAQSGGGLGIASQVGSGTQVTVWLPITDELASDDDGEVFDAPVAPRPIHVLLVDDEDMVRYTTRLQLRDLGYQVTDAPSAAAAMALIDNGLVPDVLVTDHIMADRTGAQLAQDLRQRFAQLPVLIITGYANLTPSQIRGYEVLSKPFRRAELAARLLQLVNPG
ncbi:PAS domain S-box protein [Pseudomonas sp. GCEP-101]|uniref:PAS domain S-box protein n=1 Tax=Pseudomonas sp. GCEP-101 TaxID=2974552 RepID=UPI00223BE2F3|nr:PAS domain S-box protein [Pseudomonas sp. GCEP-101]